MPRPSPPLCPSIPRPHSHPSVQVYHVHSHPSGQVYYVHPQLLCLRFCSAPHKKKLDLFDNFCLS
ncbi:unnamed protein product [Staurois parvus]|uniref:Uncharacterized protein n=1 Tax=Staurois parvus TaxID=386267 RepID=A0ABN9H7S8_9NEOB|nr:unnamed protein product [Staurois parvus]